MYIKVKVTPGARLEKIEKKSKDHYLVWVREKAERNMANTRVCQIMALYLGVSRKSVRIISGHQSPSKILSVNI